MTYTMKIKYSEITKQFISLNFDLLGFKSNRLLNIGFYLFIAKYNLKSNFRDSIINIWITRT